MIEALNLLYYFHKNGTRITLSKDKDSKFKIKNGKSLLFSDIVKAHQKQEQNILIELDSGKVQFLAYDFDSQSHWERIERMAMDGQFWPCIINPSPRGGHLIFPNLSIPPSSRLRKRSLLLGIGCEFFTKGDIVLLGPNRDVHLCGMDGVDWVNVESSPIQEGTDETPGSCDGTDGKPEIQEGTDEDTDLVGRFVDLRPYIERMQIPPFMFPTKIKQSPPIGPEGGLLKEGERNNSIFSWATATKGTSEVIRNLSKYFCEPPLMEDEIQQLIRSVGNRNILRYESKRSKRNFN